MVCAPLFPSNPTVLRYNRLLAALINSLYSFWWDVTNDWGFNLLKLPLEEGFHSSAPRPITEPLRLNSPPLTPGGSSFNEAYTASLRSIKENHFQQRKHAHRSGLRSTLHFPVVLYPFLIALNLVLRLIWSMRLFSVVNVRSHAGLANFALKMAELFRRWMWVFVRVEWEMIKKDGGGLSKVRADDEEHELLSVETID